MQDLERQKFVAVLNLFYKTLKIHSVSLIKVFAGVIQSLSKTTLLHAPNTSVWVIFATRPYITVLKFTSRVSKLLRVL